MAGELVPRLLVLYNNRIICSALARTQPRGCDHTTKDKYKKTLAHSHIRTLAHSLIPQSLLNNTCYQYTLTPALELNPGQLLALAPASALNHTHLLITTRTYSLNRTPNRNHSNSHTCSRTHSCTLSRIHIHFAH